MSRLVIDPQAIENLRALDEEGSDAFLREIIGIYLQDTPERLVELRGLLDGRDQIAFIRAAHTVKGSSSNIGAEQVRAISEGIEHAAKKMAAASEIASLAGQVTALEQAYEEARVALEKMLG